MATTYKKTWKVKFAECDIAGIVFYPRYFEMVNFVVEEWLEDLDWSFYMMHAERHEGLPTKSVACDFSSPSKIGDELNFELSITALGKSSLALCVTAFNGGALVFKTTNVLVYVTLTQPIKSMPIPDELRERMLPYVV